jgi:hypothetical protein
LDKNHKRDEYLAQTITQLITQKKPQNVQQLVDLVRTETSIPHKEVIRHIIKLQNQGKINLNKLPEPPTKQLGMHLKTHEAYWYWTTLALTMATALSVFAIAEEAYPLVYIRYILGLILILFLPGYAFTKAFFPTHTPFKTSSKNLDLVVRIALSIGMSLAIVPLVTLLLDYTPLGVRLAPVLLTLLAITLLFATTGVIREHQILLRKAASTTDEESDVRRSP